MFLNKRMNTKFEKAAIKNLMRQARMAGSGVHLFQNNTGAELFLPKPANDGSKRVGAGKTFEGDSYFFSMVRTNELKHIESMQTPMQTPILQEEKETPMIEEKLILDQPERVTSEGTVENVVAAPKASKKMKNESRRNKAQDPDVLLTEDPMSGVEILRD